MGLRRLGLTNEATSYGGRERTTDRCRPPHSNRPIRLVIRASVAGP